MRRRLNVENPGLYLVNAEGKRVARITTLTMELLDEPEEVLAEPPAELLPTGFDAVAEVWSHYVRVMKPRSAGLDAQTRTVVREALKVATIDECKRAIDGCKASDFHMGVNDRRKKYNRISHILKGKRGTRTIREQIDLFIDIAEKKGIAPGMTSGDSARINSAKRDVLAAYEFPGDDHAVRRGGEAREWLQGQGWTIEADDTGWPTFAPPRQ